MRAKVLPIVLLGIAIPITFLGLIDPLEGGLGLIAATAIYAVAFFLLRKAPPKILWIPFLVALIVGLVTLGLAILDLDRAGPLPPPILIGLWGYRLAVLAALVGGVITFVKQLRDR